MKRLSLLVGAVMALAVPMASGTAFAQDKGDADLGGLSKKDDVHISRGAADSTLKHIGIDKSIVSGVADAATTISVNTVNGADNIVLGTAENAGAFVSNLADGDLLEAGASLGKTIASPVVGIAQVSAGIGVGAFQLAETAVSGIWNGFMGLFGASDSVVRGDNSHRTAYAEGLSTTTGFAYPTSKEKAGGLKRD